MRPRQCLYALFAIFFMASQVGAQQITGRLVEQGSGQPMSAVQVSISGTGIGALSQATGRYLLLNVPVGTHTVTAQRIGYKTVTAQVTVAAGQTVVQDFTLSEEALGLDEIIVTGTPGGTQRRAIGNSVLSVSVAALTESTVQNDMKTLLRGRTPGVTLGAGSGVGSGADITIRGVGSFDRTRSNPIVFVDGVRINTTPAGPVMRGQNQARSNPLDDFSPEDIESVEIIKGPAAATLYGTEASAGVIQIITKKGREGAPSFTAAVTQGRVFNRAPNDKIGVMWTCTKSLVLPCVGGLDGVTTYSIVHQTDWALDQGTFNPYWSNKPNGACGVEACWPRENFFQYGPSYNYNLDVRGGTDRIRYFLSGNSEKTTGPQYFNWDGASRLRANVSVVFSDKFSLDISSGFISGQTSYDAQVGSRGGIWDGMIWGFGYCTPLVSQSGTATTSAPGCARTLGMQQWIGTDQSPIVSTRDYDRFTGSGTLNFKAGSWLSSRMIVGLDKGWDVNTWLHPIETRQSNVILERQEGQIMLEYPKDTNVSFDASATITKQISAINTSTSFGAQFYSKTRSLLRNTGNGFASPASLTINQTPIARGTLDYEYVENKSLGFYAQEQLGWNDRIFLTGALRFDDNSAFGANFDPLLYPKLSGTWVVSEETFWPLSFMNTFRVRGAWGKAGRQPSTLAGVNTFSAVAGPGGTSALRPGSTGNPDVGPEKSTELELGFDASAFEGLVSGEFSWYNRTNADNLLGVTVPASLGGAASVQQNVGVLKNWGWEASVDTRVYQGQTTQVGLGLTAAYKMNEITDIGAFPGNANLKIGWPYPNRTAQYIYTRAEVDPKASIVLDNGTRVQLYCAPGVLPDEALNHENPRDRAPLTSRYGMMLVPGRRGFTQLAANTPDVKCESQAGTRTYMGPAFSPYTLSISPTITIQNTVTITALVDGAYGGLGEDRISTFHNRYNNALGSIMRDDPLYAGIYRLDNWANGDYYYRSFWKLRDVSLRYQMPDSWMGRIGAKRGSLTFAGNELATLWNKSTGMNIYPDNKQMDLPVEANLDVDYGQAGEGNGGLRGSPPITSFNVRFDVVF